MRKVNKQTASQFPNLPPCWLPCCLLQTSKPASFAHS